MSLLGAGYGGAEVNVRRITEDGEIPSFGKISHQNKPLTKAEIARKSAETHIQNGTENVVKLIYTGVEEACKLGRFKAVFMLKNNLSHLKDSIIKSLKDDGFSIEIGSQSPHREEISLNISW